MIIMANAALLLIVGEPLTPSHKDLLLAEITKGFRGWDEIVSGVDINAELVRISDRASPGQDGPEVSGKSKGGESIIHHASPSILVEILVNPQTQTVKKSLKNFLTTTVSYRHLIYAGHSFQGSGAWLLQDDSFQFARFAQVFKDPEVEQVLKENMSTLNVHCAGEGEWKNDAVQKLELSKLLQICMNPEEKLADVTGAVRFSAYISSFLESKHVTSLLPASEIVGNIRFNKPTIYIFPGCEGDSCLFGISGFNLLVNGGYSRRSCFWDFTCHLDRIDAVLLTHLGTDNIFGIGSALERKSLENVYPDIGHIFLNASTKAKHSPEGEDLSVDLMKKSHLLVNLSEEGNCILEYSRQLGHVPNACTRPPLSPTLEPVNLYHKVGHGSLDMYILTPVKDTKEMKSFCDDWNKLSSNFGSHNGFPNENLLSVSTLVVWRPDNPTENITRILFPGNSPQNRIFEGLEKLKGLDYLKHPVCCSRLLTKQKEVPAAPNRSSPMKTTTTTLTTTKVVDKAKPPTSLATRTVRKQTVGVTKPPVNDVRKRTPVDNKPIVNDKQRPASPEKTTVKAPVATKKPKSAEKVKSVKEKPAIEARKAKPVKLATSPTKTKESKFPERKSPERKSPEHKSLQHKSQEHKSIQRKSPEHKSLEHKSPERKSPEQLPSPQSPEKHAEPIVEVDQQQTMENEVINTREITSEALNEADSEPQPLPEPVAIPPEDPFCPYGDAFRNGLEHEVHDAHNIVSFPVDDAPEPVPEHVECFTEQGIDHHRHIHSMSPDNIEESEPVPENSEENIMAAVVSLPCETNDEEDDSAASVLEHRKPEVGSFLEDYQTEISHGAMHEDDPREEYENDPREEYENDYSQRQSQRDITPLIELSQPEDMPHYHGYEDEHVEPLKDEEPLEHENQTIQDEEAHGQVEPGETFEQEGQLIESFHEEVESYQEHNHQHNGMTSEDPSEQVEHLDEFEHHRNESIERNADVQDQFEHEIPVDHSHQMEDSDEDNVGMFESEKDLNLVEPLATNQIDLQEIGSAEVDNVENTEYFESHTHEGDEGDDMQRDSLERETETEYCHQEDHFSHHEGFSAVDEPADVEDNTHEHHDLLYHVDNSSNIHITGEHSTDNIHGDLHEMSSYAVPEMNLYEEETGSTLPAAFEKDVTPDPTAPASYDGDEFCDGLHDDIQGDVDGVCIENIIHEEDDADVRNGRDVEEYGDMAEIDHDSHRPTGEHTHLCLQPGLDGVNPFCAIDQQAIEQIHRHGDDEIADGGSDNEEQSFNPIKEWGEPMALPQPMQTSPTAGGDASVASKRPTSATTEYKRSTKSTFDRLAISKTRPTSARVERTTATKTTLTRRPLSSGTRSTTSTSTSRTKTNSVLTPIYVDLTYIPAHGNPAYSDIEFFKNVRARYYVLSTLAPNPRTLSALLDAKKTWGDKDLEVSVIPTYESDNLRHWMALNADQLNEFKIDVVPAASRCTIQLQDHDTNCLAYRLEF